MLKSRIRLVENYVINIAARDFHLLSSIHLEGPANQPRLRGAPIMLALKKQTRKRPAYPQGDAIYRAAALAAALMVLAAAPFF